MTVAELLRNAGVLGDTSGASDGGKRPQDHRLAGAVKRNPGTGEVMRDSDGEP